MEEYAFIKSLLEELTSKNGHTTLSEVVNEIRNLQFEDFNRDILKFSPEEIEGTLQWHRHQAKEFIEKHTNFENTDDGKIFKNLPH